MGHDKVVFEPNNEFYKFEGGMKKMSIALILVGIVGAIWAFFDNHGANMHSRFWSNLLLNTYYFNGMAIAAVFFVSAHTIGYGGWFIVVKRVIEGLGTFVYVSIPIFILIILGIWLDWHNLYHHWTHASADDTIVGDKKAFLNPTTYTTLAAVFFIGWIFLIHNIRKHSLASDHAANEYEYNQKSKYWAAAYIVLFGVSSSVFSWMALMSLDPHWYSTMFGWYNFASYMCGFLCMAILIITYLKYKGHMTYVNDSHMHNLVLFLFGFSVFWTYTWFSQFMLQWYANIPEDTMWFVKRFDVKLFHVIFLATFVINFCFPFLFLLKRNAKRNPWIYSIAAVILLFGHYLDFYFMTMFEPNAPMHHTVEANEPAHHTQAGVKYESKMLAQNEANSATKHEETNTAVAVVENDAHEAEAAHAAHADVPATPTHSEVVGHETKAEGAHSEGHGAEHGATLGLIEIMMFMGFVGAFFYCVLSAISKNRLVPIKNPFLDESLHYKW